MRPFRENDFPCKEAWCNGHGTSPVPSVRPEEATAGDDGRETRAPTLLDACLSLQHCLELEATAKDEPTRIAALL
jgi:hypothetical protein